MIPTADSGQSMELLVGIKGEQFGNLNVRLLFTLKMIRHECERSAAVIHCTFLSSLTGFPFYYSKQEL